MFKIFILKTTKTFWEKLKTHINGETYHIHGLGNQYL